jgi:hypothetical protein
MLLGDAPHPNSPFKDWPIGSDPYQFHCNFENVDAPRFPNSDEQLAARERRKAQKAGKDAKASRKTTT